MKPANRHRGSMRGRYRLRIFVCQFRLIKANREKERDKDWAGVGVGV